MKFKMSREDEEIDDAVVEETGEDSSGSGKFDKVISDPPTSYWREPSRISRTV